MLYQVNNKEQAIGIADYSVNNFLNVFETSYDENVKQTQWMTLAHAIRIEDDNGVQLPYL